MVDNSKELSAEQLRSKLSHVLREKGLVGSLQSQLRHVLVKELQSRDTDQGLFRGAASLKSGREASPFLRAANSLVVDHLKRCHYEYTLGVFVPETGDPEARFLSLKELLAFLQISPDSALYKNLVKKSSDTRKRGFLWQLLSELAHLHGYGGRDMAIQTDPSSFVNHQRSLEEQFHCLDRQYSSLSDELYTKHSVEERMLQFQRQVDERAKTELQLECARFRDNELARMQMEERETSRQQVDKLRREMEQGYRTKYEMLAERERYANEKLQKATEIQEREIYNQRQTLLDEIESVRQREAAVRRQQEIDKREQQLWDEKIKAREETAKQKEEHARRLEIELTQKIHDQVNKFKVDEQGRLMERLQNVELREARVKDNERKVYEDQQDIERVKAELRENRRRVADLEGELVQTRHSAITAERQAEVLNERAKEFAEHSVVRESNTVLKRQVDDLRQRIQELTKDVLVERQRNEELLREIGHVNSLPTSEVFQLRKQVEKLQSEVRQEKAFSDHKKVQMERRYQSEVERNQELMRKFEDQTLQSREMIKEMNDYRQQLQHTKVALTNEVYRKPKRDMLNESDSMCDSKSDYVLTTPASKLDDPEPVMAAKQPTDHQLLMAEIMQEEGDSSHSYSYGVDLVRETKRRLQGLESEAANLQENYRNFQLRLTSAAALPPADMTLTSVTPTKTRVTFGERDSFGRDYSPAIAGSAVKRSSRLSLDTDRRVSSTPSKLQVPGARNDQLPEMNTTVSTIPNSSPLAHIKSSDKKDERAAVSGDILPATASLAVTTDRLPPVPGRAPHETSSTPQADVRLSLDDAWRSQLDGGDVDREVLLPVTQSAPAVDVLQSLDDAWKGTERQLPEKTVESAMLMDVDLGYGDTGEAAGTKTQEDDTNIDPVMQKYMAMVKEQKDKEKQVVKKAVDTWRKDDNRPSSSHSVSEDISGADNNDSSFHSAGKGEEDFW